MKQLKAVHWTAITFSSTLAHIVFQSANSSSCSDTLSKIYLHCKCSLHLWCLCPCLALIHAAVQCMHWWSQGYCCGTGCWGCWWALGWPRSAVAAFTKPKALPVESLSPCSGSQPGGTGCSRVPPKRCSNITQMWTINCRSRVMLAWRICSFKLGSMK